ncbi:MAG: GAF domain-containing protein [Mangrovicoccus sp.]
MYALADLHILAQGSDEDLNWIIDLACERLNADCAVLAMIDGPGSEMAFLPRCREAVTELCDCGEVAHAPSQSTFCGHVQASGQVLAVSDFRLEKRFQRCEFAENEGFEAYLGAPIFGPAQDCIGSLCVLTNHPRLWTEQNRKELVKFANLVNRLVLLRASLQTIKLICRRPVRLQNA